MTDGKLDVLEGALKQGATVGNEEGFTLLPEDQALLLESIRQAECGEAVDGWQLLDELRQ